MCEIYIYRYDILKYIRHIGNYKAILEIYEIIGTYKKEKRNVGNHRKYMNICDIKTFLGNI